ncbi:MAG: hypothetical protein BGO69_08010 [Bacteroidetes bacterium 46-16]|nr:MAG: hypothetical protein BGO69_08010 [Bacteroidetes bacterium 46-16]
MKRRDFLKVTPAAAMAYMMNGLPVKALAASPLLKLLARQAEATGRVMVFIQLVGGNDGLNTIIPIDQYSALSTARGNVLIPEEKVLKLNGILETGFHPAMSGLRDLFNNSMVNIVQGASYTNPNYSHFRATDIWLTGASSNQYLNDGWLGRYLADENPDYPQVLTPDPLAIQIGATVSTALQGPNVNMGMAVTSIENFYNIVNNQVTPAPPTPAGHELTFLRFIAQQTQQYTSSLQAAAAKANNLSKLYPEKNSLADQLKIVARLIAGGLSTPVYMVSLGGFDTHAGQVEGMDTTTGTHADLLGKLSTAVTAFFDDLKLLKVDDRVAAMTFSEFGRRILSNGGLGTDHGTAAPVMVFGKYVNPGIIGSNPVIPDNATVRDDLEMQYDYRKIYAAVLTDWFGAPREVWLDALQDYYTPLPIFRKDDKQILEERNEDPVSQNYPNPFSDKTCISFNSQGGSVRIMLYDAAGRMVKLVADKEYDAGYNHVYLYREGLPPGNYVYKFMNWNNKASKKLTIID